MIESLNHGISEMHERFERKADGRLKAKNLDEIQLGKSILRREIKGLMGIYDFRIFADGHRSVERSKTALILIFSPRRRDRTGTGMARKAEG